MTLSFEIKLHLGVVLLPLNYYSVASTGVHGLVKGLIYFPRKEVVVL